MDEDVEPPAAVANDAGSAVGHQVHVATTDLGSCLTIYCKHCPALGTSSLSMVWNLLLPHDILLETYLLTSKKPQALGRGHLNCLSLPPETLPVVFGLLPKGGGVSPTRVGPRKFLRAEKCRRRTAGLWSQRPRGRIEVPLAASCPTKKESAISNRSTPT